MASAWHYSSRTECHVAALHLFPVRAKGISSIITARQRDACEGRRVARYAGQQLHTHFHLHLALSRARPPSPTELSAAGFKSRGLMTRCCDLFYGPGRDDLIPFPSHWPLACVSAGGSSVVVQLYDNMVCGALLAVWCPVTTG